MKLRVAVFINLIMLLFIISAQESVLNDTVWEIADFLELDGIVNVGYDIAKSNIGKTIVYKNNKINIDNLKLNSEKIHEKLLSECEVALNQIEEKEYTSILKNAGIDNILKIGIAFFGKEFELCSYEQQKQIADELPMRISEVYTVSKADNTEKGGTE